MARPRVLTLVLGIPVLLFAAIQLVPYGRNHANPPDGQLVAFDSPATEELAKKACFDCHSNRTKWPWYSNIAPMSWRIQRHVDEGREHLNFTAFDPASKKMAEGAGEAAEEVADGKMPLNDYLLAHPEARLTADEKKMLVAGLEKTFAAFAGKGEKGGKGGEAGVGAEAGERGEKGESAEHEKAEGKGH